MRWVWMGVTGLSQTGVKDLNYKLIYVANWVRVENNSFNDEREAKEEDEEEENIGGYTDEKEMERICRDIPTSKYELIRKMKNNPNIFDALAESLFPAIFGHT
jgi:DNA replicative helicase MCM subunit Mcm2 (Cdc46/Mcm family)